MKAFKNKFEKINSLIKVQVQNQSQKSLFEKKFFAKNVTLSKNATANIKGGVSAIDLQGM